MGRKTNSLHMRNGGTKHMKRATHPDCALLLGILDLIPLSCHNMFPWISTVFDRYSAYVISTF